MPGVHLTWKRVNVSGNFAPRDGHCACSCGGKVFIFGGVIQTSVEGEHRESNDLLMFDPGRGSIFFQADLLNNAVQNCTELY